MKKKKLPKYIQQIFTKPQFKKDDLVKYEFLGDSGWGIVKKIINANDKITYMVKGNGYTYPCGIQIKEYCSYYAGSIDFETSKARSNNATAGDAEIKKRINNSTRKRVSGFNSNTISDTGSGYGTTIRSRNGNEQHIGSDSKSKKSNKSSALDKEIDKQRNFLRKFS